MCPQKTKKGKIKMEKVYYKGCLVLILPTPRIPLEEISFLIETANKEEKIDIFLDETIPRRIRERLIEDEEFITSLTISEAKKLLDFLKTADICYPEDYIHKLRQALKQHPNLAVKFLAG